ncbi:MAG TPA: hypothetical protein VM553_19520 [Dongiaceae bacterium]|nr:hypothetical protein [Dongiaceae bacterium]
MPHSEEFCDSPYQFMKKHIVVVTISDQFKKPDRNLVTAFVVEDDKANVAEKPQSKVFKLYLVEDPTAPQPPPHTREVYWCHYERNTSHGSMLGMRHAYMFTPTMTGCTLGVGSQNKGSVRVAHCNMKPSEPVRGAMAFMQAQARQQLQTLQGDFAQAQRRLRKVVQPFDYMQGDKNIDLSRQATTFGRRNDKDEWKFYSQIYRKVDRTYYHFGVKDFTHGII